MKSPIPHASNSIIAADSIVSRVFHKYLASQANKKRKGFMIWVEHHGIEALLIYALFSAIVGGMPTPADNAGVFYRWTFGTLNLLSASVARLVATQFPASKMGQALQGAQPVQPVVVAEIKDKP